MPTSGTSTIVKDSVDGSYTSVRFDNGQGWIVATFAESNARVLELAHTDAAKEKERIEYCGTLDTERQEKQ